MNKYIARVTVCFLLLSTLVKAQPDQSARKEFFAGLPFWESPLQPFKGEYPISESEALQRIHLRFDYDDQNRIIEVSVRIGNEYKEFEGFFGNVQIHATSTKIIYTRDKELHSFYDRFGNRIPVMGSVWESVYTKDTHGCNVSLHFNDKQGNASMDMWGVQKYTWQHQLDGSVIELRTDPTGKIVPLRGQFQFMKTRIFYGSDGCVSTLQNIDDSGNLVNAPCGAAILKYYYDTFGRFSRWEVYDKEGKSAKGPSDTNGEQNLFDGFNLTHIVFFDEYGKPATHWSGVEKWNMEYDRFGNVKQLNYQNADGKKKNANNGYASIRYEWSVDGRFLISQSYLDETGNSKEHPSSGVAKIIHTRHENGQISETKYLGADGKPKSRKDTGTFVTTYLYNGENELVETILWDKEGNRKQAK